MVKRLKTKLCRNCTKLFYYPHSDKEGKLCIGIGSKAPKGVYKQDVVRLCLFKKDGSFDFSLHMTTTEAENIGLALIRTKTIEEVEVGRQLAGLIRDASTIPP